MPRPPFIHLHTHSHYSLLDGLSKVPEMVALAKEYEMPAIALTDHGNLHGAIEFYKECKKNDVKPIIGVEAYVTPGSRHDKRAGIDTTRYHLTLLAKNEAGYKNLITLVTKSFLEGYYYKPRIDKELMRQYAEGLVCLSGCFGGEINHALRNSNVDQAREVAREHQEIYGRENYFLEIMHHPGVPGIEEVRERIINLSKELDIPLVATQDSHYLHSEDTRAHETLLAIQTNADLNDENRFSMRQDDFSFIDTKKAYEYFSDTPEAIENTKRVADMCELEIDLDDWIFPNFPIPKDSTYDKELEKATYEGIEWRGLDKNDAEVVKRVEYELKTIRDKGYSSYFLVVADLMNHAREQGILTNVRGSVGGSLASYVLGITNINPLAYKLPFERFMNPERPSMPDIDMDFADSRRDEVIEYAKQKYGEDKVAQIGTFGAMLARGAVRDVARALGHPYATGDKIARLIPQGSQGFPMTIDGAFKENPELKELYDSDETTRDIIDLARRLEGCVRHVSVHAAGVVISPVSLERIVPLQFDPRGGKIITQYDMYTGDRDGVVNLPKFDFLGITNLTMLEKSIALVKEYRDEEIDIERIPQDDKKTFDLIARGRTMGIFQLGSDGMTRYLKELKPESISDISLMVALYRPGPMNNIDEYIARKRGKKPTTYPHPKMKSFLEPTCGVLVYQEDLLMTAVEVAGYSWGEVDRFRKAVGKKLPAEMARQHKIFIEGCKKHGGLTERQAEEIWKLFEPFQGYGFNKAHAASYGYLAYQTAYMKANYPVEYMTAVLIGESGNTEKLAEVITECGAMGIDVLPPDINESFTDFTPIIDGEKERIRFGLHAIKNLGSDISEAIIEEREKNGAFSSFADLLERVHHRNLNRKSLEALIKAGAFDAFRERGLLLHNLERALSYHKQCMDTGDQASLFGDSGDTSQGTGFTLEEAPETKSEEKLAWERELLGLYISGHPLDRHRERLQKNGADISKVKKSGYEGENRVIAGVVEDIREVTTKKGERMAFVRVADFGDAIEVVLFPRVFVEYKDIAEQDKCVAVKGRMSERNGEKSLIAGALKEL